MVPTEEAMERLGLSTQDLVAYFYADDGLLAATQPRRLQRALNILTILFGQVFLRENMQKTMIMACQICHAYDMMLVEAYERRKTGTGPTFWEGKWRRLECPEFRIEVTAGSLLTHHQV